MSAEKATPDVVVVGMPSCGKTVFLTVLGKKLTNLVNGRCGAPLGFRFETCDMATTRVVDAVFDRFRKGSWPRPTDAGQVMPLRWDVYTGRRRIFELFSMDVAGETFIKAFGIETDDAGGGGTAKLTTPGRKPQAGSDLGDELYHGETETEDAAVADGQETHADKAAVMLRDAIRTAKVVCFMVNIAHPDELSGNDSDEVKFLRFRSSVTNIFLSLKNNAELRAKSVIVLTQAQWHRGGIEKAGGPVMYLGSPEVYGGDGAQLCNLAKECNIPVIAVSAINEEVRGQLPAIRSFEDISSSGLLGFLLTVAGFAAREDSIARVKDAYVDYSRERAEYLRNPSRLAKARLAQARKYHDAANAFVEACDRYLNDEDNLNGSSKTDRMSPSCQEDYKRYTNADPEVRSALECVYFVRDELWDRALRKAVISGGMAADEIYDQVCEGLEKVFPDKVNNRANANFAYGFMEDDFLAGSRESTYRDWIEHSLDEYRNEYDRNVRDLVDLKNRVAVAADSLQSSIGESDFDACLSLAKGSCGLFGAKLSDFRSKWLDCSGAKLQKIDGMETEVAGKRKLVEDCESKNDDCNRKRLCQRQAAERKIALRRRGCKILMILVFVVGMIVLPMIFLHYYHVEKNNDVVRSIERMVADLDYAGARRLCDSLYTNRLLRIERKDFFSGGFAERLAMAEECQAVRKKVDDSYSRFDKCAVWLKGLDAPSEEEKRVIAKCDAIKDLYVGLPSSAVSFAEINGMEPDIGSRIDEYRKCERLLQDLDLIPVIEKIQEDRRELERRSNLERGIREARELLAKIDPKNESLDLAEVSMRIQETERLGLKIRGLTQACGGNDAAVTLLEHDADDVLKRLNDLSHALEKAKVAGEIAEVRSAMSKIDPKNESLDLAEVSMRIQETERLGLKIRGLTQACGGNDAAVAQLEHDADDVLKRLNDLSHALEKAKVAGEIAEVRSAMSNSVSLAWVKYDAMMESLDGNDECGELANLNRQLCDATRIEFERCLSRAENAAELLANEKAVSEEMLKKMRKIQALVGSVRDKLRKRFPQNSEVLAKLESRAQSLLERLPTVVQVDGVVPGQSQIVKLRDAGKMPGILNGTSPETQTDCVYLLVQREACASGISRFLRVVDENGIRYSLAIALSKLSPGINRFDVKGNQMTKRRHEDE